MTEEPIEHPALAKYPDSPTALSRVDGVLYRVPMLRDRDEAVAVPVNDLVQARTAVYQLQKLIEGGAGDDYRLETISRVLVFGTADRQPTTREELARYLTGLRERLNGWLPHW